jgi:ADP-heptose:LPS heptosyltransferase
VYAQYYIGANNIDNIKYSPTNSTKYPLQRVASKTLGLEDKEICPNIFYENMKNRQKRKYVCISEFSSNVDKNWKGDWQRVVDFLISKGYDVIVISKEFTTLKGVINKTGNIFIGNSSGLSWLAWALKKKVVMISDTTPLYHEFQNNNLRIGKNNGVVDYKYMNHTTTEEVISTLISYINRLSL